MSRHWGGCVGKCHQSSRGDAARRFVPLEVTNHNEANELVPHVQRALSWVYWAEIALGFITFRRAPLAADFQDQLIIA